MRIYCHRCERPEGHCLCSALISLNSPLAVKILQHPDEKNFVFKTAHLAALQLDHCSIFRGETFSRDEIITTPQAALIYLSEKSASLNKAKENLTELIFLDGTWKKTTKLLNCNPWLKELPQYHLDVSTPSKLAPLRKSNRESALSTLEAVALALKSVTGKESYQQINNVLDKWLNLQTKFDRS